MWSPDADRRGPGAAQAWHDHSSLEGCAGACARLYRRDAASDRSGKSGGRREVVEGAPSANDAATVAAQLRWHGLQAEPRTIRAHGHPVPALLSSAAEACSADLLIMGSYGTGPLREEIFGGCTRSILN